MTADAGADADWASCFQKPEATMFDHGRPGRRPSTVPDGGPAGSQVGGSRMAGSAAGKAPTIGLSAPTSLVQLTMALRPAPDLDAAESPLTSEPPVRKAAPPVPAPR